MIIRTNDGRQQPARPSDLGEGNRGGWSLAPGLPSLRHEFERIADHVLMDEAPVRPANVEFLAAHLDGDFPAARRADELPIRQVADDPPGRLAQLRVIPPEPEEGMRIEQECHSMYSLKSSSGALKSGA